MIYIITHKSFKTKVSKDYLVLKVGNSNSVEYRLCDNTGDNISEKNQSFCELTGLYWIWKNRKTDDIVGLVHYRRFFVNHIWNKIDKHIPLKYRAYSISQSKKILKNYDIILPQKIKFDETILQQYDRYHFKKDIDVIKCIINEKYPDYNSAFDFVMNEYSMCAYNMFISSKIIMDGYCRWLFDILFEAEKRINISEYNSTQKRVFGYLSERLLNVYCVHNNLRIHYGAVEFFRD